MGEEHDGDARDHDQSTHGEGARQRAGSRETSASSGACRCGAVRVFVQGAPLRVGICHCTDCRQESGSAFTFYGIWPADRFERVGDTAEYEGRQFCARCGSRMFSVNAREAEIKLGILSAAPTEFTPSYELWIKRREPWLRPIEGAEQHDEDRS